MPKSAKVSIFILFVLVLLSLALNGAIIWQLLLIRQQAQRSAKEIGTIIQESLDRTIADLENVENTAIEFDVAVNQDFPIDTEIAFEETIEVPIQMTVPISQTIDTTIFVELVGGVEVPVDIAVPVNVEIPIDNTIQIPFARSIPISTTIPLSTEVPIKINIGESQLAEQIVRLRQDLISLNDLLERLLGDLE